VVKIVLLSPTERRFPMVQMRRSALVIAASAAACLVTALSGVASAAPAAGGIKGNPQPELKPFIIGSSKYAGGSVALEPNGTLVVARGTTSGDGKIVVCVLARGASKCASSVTLTPPGVDLFGTPEVFIPSANHVVVLMDSCCDRNPAGGDLLFSSVNGGKSFAPAKRIGSLGVSTAALVGKDIVFTSGDDHDGSEVESVPVTASGPPATTAIANPLVAYDAGVGSYKGGALIGSDYLGTDYETLIEYAAAGKNFDASASYVRVGAFKHEQLFGISGNALLTVQTTGKELLLVRLFNGKSFGPAHAVPGLSNHGPGWFTIDQDPSGAVHVFSETASSAVSYDLYERSTATGASWSSPLALGYAADSNTFGVGLDATGAGLVLGTASDQSAWGFPVLAGQSASFGLKAAAIKKGKATTAVGIARPAAKGRVVALQVEKGGLWYTVATTHEGTGGKFGFTIKGTAAGTYDYRAVVADWAGYRLYGYSPARALKVVS
jgi:hypothetical protein